MANHVHSEVDKEMQKSEFRVALFGSARVEKGDRWYKQIYRLAKAIGKMDVDVVTGGGPGLMEAANRGHKIGVPKGGKAHSIGLTIELPWENKANKYLDMEEHFQHFSKRLDDFMMLSSVAVICPGGVGTCLEFFYTWQLTQVKHICPIPIILVGRMYKGLVKWIKQWPLKKGLISPEDMDNVFHAKDNEEALRIIEKANKAFKEGGGCINYQKYKLSDKD